MPLRIYVKDRHPGKRRLINKLSYLSLIIGAILLFWSFYPVISFEIYSRIFIKNNIMSPFPGTTVASLQEAGSVLGDNKTFSNNLRDFTQVKLWFPSKKPEGSVKKISLKEYTLTIPKLNINKAKVSVGGEDLTKYLVHYLPTSLPGEYGNIAIFGHSTLPQLYNSRDYKTIFTYLPSLEKNDKIIVTVGEVDYEYDVYEMFVVKPEQVSILEQNYDASYLTLVTCVPPGTYWNRLVIKARMTKLPY